MLVFGARGLSSRDRDALVRALAEPASLEHVTRPPSRPAIAAVLGLALASGVVAVWPHEHAIWDSPLDLVVPCSALAVALVALAVVWMLRRRALARAPWRCGVFLHRFGVLHAEPDVVRYVPGTELDEPTFETQPWHGVRLRAGGWTVRMPVDEERWKGLFALMDGLPYARWARADGYRDHASPLDHLPVLRGRPPLTPLARIVTSLALGALVGGLAGWHLVMPEVALRHALAHGPAALIWFRDHLDTRWTHARATAAFERERDEVREHLGHATDEPFRGQLLALLPARFEEAPSQLAYRSVGCEPHAFVGSLGPIRWSSESQVETFRAFRQISRRDYSIDYEELHPLGELTVPIATSAAVRRGVMTVSCTFVAEPGWMPSGRRRIDVRATIELAVDGRPAISREVIVSDDRVSQTYEEWWEGVRLSLDTEVARALVTHHPDGDRD